MLCTTVFLLYTPFAFQLLSPSTKASQEALRALRMPPATLRMHLSMVSYMPLQMHTVLEQM